MKFIIWLVLMMTAAISPLSYAVKNTCQAKYVPPYTAEDLENVYDWAQLGAFFAFAKEAKVDVDHEKYLADVPNQALFGFAAATGTNCIERDLRDGFLSLMYALGVYWGKDLRGELPENVSFQTYYLKYAYQFGFDQYIVTSDLPNEEEILSLLKAQ